MSFDEATRAQVTAAHPERSTWLSANAGSGKTRVLTDRVARLLLQDVPPERILCLTYTKAAASEMQNRLFKRLGEWAMLDEDALRAAMEQLGIDSSELSPRLLSHARTLFARAIETPGGLKIQTIHSFCSAVLRRFPLEAGVSPRFAEMDERAQETLAVDVLDKIADGVGRTALDALAAELGGDDAMPIIRAMLSQREELSSPATRDEIWRWFGLAPADDAAGLLADVFQGDEDRFCSGVLSQLDPEKRTDAANHRRLSAINWGNPGLADLVDLESVFLTGSTTKMPDKAKIGTFPTKAKWAALIADHPELEDFMLRVEAARPRRRALAAAGRTLALHQFAAAFLPAYAKAKSTLGWLDFDDLILRTKDLLANSDVAAWVLFRLDGGIDHILVDEAQDTSPAQWQIVAQLAGEFAAGSGARDDVSRTIFVVGDKKQSIYSFQGADPEGFDRMRDYFQSGLTEIGAPFQSRELIYSFRSAPPILKLVDTVFQAEPNAGVGDAHHIAFKGDLPGRVDVWPVVEKSPPSEPADWDDPIDMLAEDHHTVVLAERVAQAIEQMLADGTPIVVDGHRRAVQPGDILILVQRRSPLFHELIGAIKKRDLPLAGADRMRLGGELAVKDLTALLAFLATPEDDLSLAAILRSPLLGLTEAQLFDLAHPRGDRYLWRELQNREEEFPQVVSVLQDLRDRADFLRPYDLIERMLMRHDGRRRFLARLGQEAEDGIDTLLAQAMAYERLEVPSLTGFVGWLQAGDITVKRDASGAGNQIRVMSVHGAKGLESPVVVLPDTGLRRAGRQGPKLMAPQDGPLLWALAKDDAPEAIREALEAATTKDSEERNRLLYVAMTRAESWLITCAAGDIETKSGGSWYTHIRDAAIAAGATQHDFFQEAGWRLETGDWSRVEASGDLPAVNPALPQWAEVKAAPEDGPPAALSPSELGGVKALPGDQAGLDEDAAKLRGRRVHLLLEHLPDLPKPAWAGSTPGILAAEGAVADDEMQALFEEAASCLTAPHLGDIFSAGALEEVSLTAESPTLGTRLMGQIDRLIITPDRVLAVDFKSNAIVPDRAESAPEGLLRQMGAYAEMLAAIYPDRHIETAILWTKTARLMPLPHDLVTEALQRAASP